MRPVRAWSRLHCALLTVCQITHLVKWSSLFYSVKDEKNVFTWYSLQLPKMVLNWSILVLDQTCHPFVKIGLIQTHRPSTHSSIIANQTAMHTGPRLHRTNSVTWSIQTAYNRLCYFLRTFYQTPKTSPNRMFWHRTLYRQKLSVQFTLPK